MGGGRRLTQGGGVGDRSKAVLLLVNDRRRPQRLLPRTPAARTRSHHQMLCFALRRTQQVVVLAGEEGFEPSIS